MEPLSDLWGPTNHHDFFINEISLSGMMSCYCVIEVKEQKYFGSAQQDIVIGFLFILLFVGGSMLHSVLTLVRFIWSLPTDVTSKLHGLSTINYAMY